MMQTPTHNNVGTYHFHPTHTIGATTLITSQWFCGVALFRNSFGQPSTYVYVGKQWNGVLDTPKLFTKVSAGLIYGYKGQYQHKIPFNDYGIAPAIIPSLGWHISPEDSAQVMVLGKAGLLFAYGRRF